MPRPFDSIPHEQVMSMFQLVTLILTVKVRIPFVNYDINVFSLGEEKRSK